MPPHLDTPHWTHWHQTVSAAPPNLHVRTNTHRLHFKPPQLHWGSNRRSEERAFQYISWEILAGHISFSKGCHGNRQNHISSSRSLFQIFVIWTGAKGQKKYRSSCPHVCLVLQTSHSPDCYTKGHSCPRYALSETTANSSVPKWSLSLFMCLVSDFMMTARVKTTTGIALWPSLLLWNALSFSPSLALSLPPAPSLIMYALKRRPSIWPRTFCWQTHTCTAATCGEKKKRRLWPTYWLSPWILWPSGRSHAGSRTGRESPHLENKHTESGEAL